MRFPASRRGFSILELMVVVAIVGIVSAVALPSISGSIRRAREPAELTRLRTFMTESRSLARRANRCVQVNFADAHVVRRTVLTTCTGTLATVCDCSASLIPITLEETLTLGSALVLEGVSGNVSSIAAVPASAANDDNLLFLPNGATPYLDAAVIDVSLPETGRRQRFSILPASGIVRQQGGPR